MSAIEEFVEEIRKTEVMSRVFEMLRREPANLLKIICEEYKVSGCALPDHRLQLNGFIEDISLKALVAAGLVYREDGGRLSLYLYGPTDKGLNEYQQLMGAGYYTKRAGNGNNAA